MANPLSSFGLAMQGADASRNVQQDYELGQSRLAAAGQNARLVDQQIETGQMGLEEVKRNRAQDTATRQAGASSIAGGNTMSGSLLDMANTEARAGRMQQALQYRQANQALEAMGGPQIVHAAISGNPGDRPDIVNIMNQYEATKGVTNATMDNAGVLTVTRNGKAAPIDIKQMGELLGIFKPKKLETIAAGGVGVITGPGVDPTKPQNQIVAPKTFAENPQHGFQTVKDAEGRETLIDIRPTVDGKPNPDFKKPVAGGGAGDAAGGGTSARKELAFMEDISKAVADLGPAYATVDMSGLNPKVMPTEKGNQVMMVANQLRLGTKDAGIDLDTRTLAQMAANGKPMWKNEGGKRTGVLLYNGQEFPMRTPTGVQQAPAKPAAAAAPAVAPAAALPGAPTIQAVGGTPVVEEAPGAVRTAQPKATGERVFATALEAKNPELKRLGDMLRLTNNPRTATNLWIDYVAMAKKLGATGYACGGKVSRRGLG